MIGGIITSSAASKRATSTTDSRYLYVSGFDEIVSGIDETVSGSMKQWIKIAGLEHISHKVCVAMEHMNITH